MSRSFKLKQKCTISEIVTPSFECTLDLSLKSSMIRRFSKTLNDSSSILTDLKLIREHPMPFDWTSSLITSLSKSTTLTSLTFSGRGFAFINESAMSAVMKLPSLQRLSFMKIEALHNDNWIHHLIEHIKSSRTLTRLELCGIPTLTTPLLRDLVRSLEVHASLKCFKFSNTHSIVIGDSIARLLTFNTTLTKLEIISDIPLVDSALQIFSALQQSNRTLTHFNLGSVPLECLPMLFDVIELHPTLVDIQCSCGDVNDVQLLQGLCVALQRSVNLKRFRRRSEGTFVLIINEQNIEILETMLKHLRLESLSLYFTCTALVETRFINALSQNMHLIEFSFTNQSNRLRNEVSAILERNLRLRWPVVHALILDIVLILSDATVSLPPYVILWIIDFLPNYARVHTAKRKIEHILAIDRSIRRIRAHRTGLTFEQDDDEGIV